MAKLSRSTLSGLALALSSFAPFALAACGSADTMPADDHSGGSAGTTIGSNSSAGTVSAGGSSIKPTGTAGGANASSSSGGSVTGGAASGGTDQANGTAGAGGKTGSAGSSSSTGGSASTGGKTGSAGSTSNTGYGPAASCKAWPTATGSTQKLSKTQSVSKDFDGKLQRFVSDGLGDGGQGESQKPVFELADGATLENVIIGAPAADGIHCDGSCTLKNVWWEDVGEDAATLKGSSSSQVFSIDCGGAKLASDKVFQHDGPGTMKISNFFVQDFGKLYRSCGNCSKQYARHAIISNVIASNGKDLAGVNENYDDTATFSGILVSSGITICQRYTGNDTGAEPKATGSGADGKVCIYQPTDIETQ